MKASACANMTVGSKTERRFVFAPEASMSGSTRDTFVSDCMIELAPLAGNSLYNRTNSV